jgi:hypothetical protein
MQTSPKFGGLYRTLGISLVIPLIVIQVLLHLGVTPLIALAAATVFPLGEMIYEAVSVKRVGSIAIVSLALLTGVFGLLFLGSLATSRPLIYRLNLDLAGADPGARAAAEALWERPAAQRSFRLITVVWGLGLLLDAAARVVAALTLPIASATALSPIISVVCIGAILIWTVRYVRARRAAAAQAAASG